MQAKCKKLTKPKSKEKTQSNIHRNCVTYKDKWSKRKLFKGIKLIKLTLNEKNTSLTTVKMKRSDAHMEAWSLGKHKYGKGYWL